MAVKTKKINCHRCGVKFSPKFFSTIYCSPKCRSEAEKEGAKKRYEYKKSNMPKRDENA